MNNKEIQSNQKIILLAQEFKKLGAYPSSRTKNGRLGLPTFDLHADNFGIDKKNHVVAIDC